MPASGREELVKKSDTVVDFLISEGVKIAAFRSQLMPLLPDKSHADLCWVPDSLSNEKDWIEGVHYFCAFPGSYCELVRKVRALYGHASYWKNLFLLVMLKDMARSGRVSKPMVWSLYQVCLLPYGMVYIENIDSGALQQQLLHSLNQ